MNKCYSRTVERLKKKEREEEENENEEKSEVKWCEMVEGLQKAAENR